MESKIFPLDLKSPKYHRVHKTHRRVNIATPKFTSSFKLSKEILQIIHL